MNYQSNEKICFADFEIDTAHRLLRRGGETLPLNSKAFDVLAFLAENAGRIVSKNEILDAVWENEFVEEANLKVQISSLRKVLGEQKDDHRYLVTVPGKGYKFVGDVSANNGEIVIEKHKVEHIVVEEETEVLESIKQKRTPAAGSLRYWPRMMTVAGPIAILIIVGLSAFLYFRTNRNEMANTTEASAARVSDTEMSVKQLTTKGSVRWVALSPDGKFFAYCLTDVVNARRESIWLGQTDNKNEVELRPSADVVHHGLAFSPDGRSLFYSVRGFEKPQLNGLYKMPILGGAAEKITEKVDTYFSFSPDGQRIAYIRKSDDGSDSALVIFDLADLSERELITRPTANDFAGNGPDWSPQGNLIAFSAATNGITESREVFTVSVTDGRVDQLTRNEWSRISNVVWINDGNGLVLVAAQKGETVRRLWRLEHPSGDVRALSRDTDGYGGALSWAVGTKALVATQIRRESNLWLAPASDISSARQTTFSSVNGIYGWNGFDWMERNRIVFTAGIDRSVALYVMDADGKNIRPITSDGYFDQRPAAAELGETIVFQSNRGGSQEIWRVNADGSDLAQITSGGGNSSPTISPDGKWVIYPFSRDGKNSLRKISVNGGEPSILIDKPCNFPSYSPNGKFVACANDDEIAIIDVDNGLLRRSFPIPAWSRVASGIRWTPDAKSICYMDFGWKIWRQPIDGRPPTPLADQPVVEELRFAWSHDGKLLATTRGRPVGDAVLITDLK